MGGMCNSEKVVYQANIFPMENSKEEKVDIRISAGNWKQRFYNHRHSFSNLLLRNQTALMKWFESLTDRDLTPQIKWRLKSSTGSFKSTCNLCLEEKISTIRYKFTCQLLNKHNEQIFKCLHKNRFKLIWKRLIIEKLMVITIVGKINGVSITVDIISDVIILVDRQYVSRKKGRRGLTCIEDSWCSDTMTWRLHKKKLWRKTDYSH